MKYIFAPFLALVLALGTLAPYAEAETSQAALLAQIQLLRQQLAAIEQQILSAPAPSVSTACWTDIYGNRYCPTTTTQISRYSTSAGDIDRIEVDFVGRMAQVRVEYDDDDDEFFAVEADTESDVARLLEPELRVAASTLLRLMDEVDDFDDDDEDDIEDIDVDWDDDDADVTVRFEDNDTDRFTLHDVDRDEDDVIEEIADRYNEDEDDIEDVIDFDDDRDTDEDIEDIDVDWDGDDADVTVRFEDGDTDRFTLSNVDRDEDDVIEELADRYDMDEDDIEDVIDFD
ncbi:hypothetical protein HY416_03435 [Candidatus Kaiserbacteria bacterium]|nr:hypothetical protein [Candidatus Kaiserbacteria bacterium]